MTRTARLRERLARVPGAFAIAVLVFFAVIFEDM